ncbi:MAG TPA: NADH:flavin oxidoreductase [Planctomycetota bacterium]|nr:NADH:flavin oxidoreductase [Planctomycetota bacterium]
MDRKPSSLERRSRYPRIGSMSLDEFRAHLASIAPEAPCDGEILRADRSPLAAPLTVGPFTIGNRWAVQPMEGWDGTSEGGPGELTFRRWKNFGESGAKLIWGGEAVAVRFDGRANPNQLVMDASTLSGLERLRGTLIGAHVARFGSAAGLVDGLQLTHSGRFARPHRSDLAEPRAAFRHPVLDARTGVSQSRDVLTDGEVEGVIADFVKAARGAREIGFRFVDIKHCHGYLLHEILGAHTREGPYGGSFENRTRALREIVDGVRRDAPGLEVGVRVSIFDLVPFRPDPARSRPNEPGPGVPEDVSGALPYRYGFGVSEADPTRPDLREGRRFLGLLEDLGIRLVNLTAGSPYYNPHIQRPALYPPSDGYEPPEDPLEGVVRQLRVVRDLKREFPGLVIVGSALSYLQDYLPHVAQAIVRDGWMDFAGIGRMVLAYWDLPADLLEKGSLDRRRICRTFSDCTTAPRNGLVSGCYPLDKHYATLPEAAKLREVKRKK